MAFSPPTGGAGTPEGIIGLQLEGRGFDTLAKDLEVGNKHLAAMEGSVSRMGQGLLGVSRTLAGMAGVAGVGALVADFMRVETAANRAAIAIDAAGSNGHAPKMTCSRYSSAKWRSDDRIGLVAPSPRAQKDRPLMPWAMSSSVPRSADVAVPVSSRS